MKRHAVFLATFFLLLSLFLSFLCLPSSATVSDGDFSRPGSSSTVTVGGADALAALGYDVSGIEREYLSVHVPVWLRYEDRISTEAVVTHCVGGTLTVYAKPYSYRSRGGETVTWIPTAVTVADETRPLVPTGDSYVASFSDVAEDISLSAVVGYETTFTIPKKRVATLADLTYEEGERIRAAYLSAQNAYKEEKEAYDAATSAYDAYLRTLGEYREARLAYEAYLTAQAVYLDEYAAYRKYLSDLQEYEREAEAYRRYLSEMEEYNRRVTAYNEYLEKLAAYNTDLDAYRRYTEALDTVSRQLSYMDSAKTVSVRQRTIYGALQGRMVETVLANEGILTDKIVGADPYEVSLAGDTTERLKNILKVYFSLTTDEEKYNYYTLNYTEIVNNYVDLFRSLDSLYRIRNVRAVLIKEEKAEKYVILLAELYTTAHLLSDAPILNLEGDTILGENYRIQHWDSAYADRYLTPAEVLGAASYPEPDGAVGTPLTGGYPAEVAAPNAPATVENPAGSKPTECYRPLPPAPRTEPTPPTPVAEPTPPHEVSAPGTAPTPPELTASERRLYSAVEDGTLVRREEPASDATLTVSSEVKKKVFDSRTVTVVFLSEEGEVLFRTTIDRGSAAIYNGEHTPVRPEDEDGIYTFDGWTTGDGTPVDLSSCEEDMTLYPHFAVTPKHRVTFSCGTGDTVLTVLHGTEARYPGEPPQKAATASTLYTFDGWYLADGTPADLSAVTGSFTVYPHFSETTRTYTVTFTVDGESFTRTLRYGELPALPNEPAPARVGDSLRTYVGLAPTPVPVCGDATYTALFADTPLFPLADGGAAAVTYRDGILTVDASASAGYTLPLSSLYLCFSDARGLDVRFSDLALSFSYAALAAVRGAIPDDLTALFEDGTRFRFAFEKDGAVCDVSVTADAQIPLGTKAKNRRLSFQNGEKCYIKFTSNGEYARFSAENAVVYTYMCEYGINVLADDSISLSYPDGTFPAGTYVPLSYRLAAGRALATLTVTDREGRSVPYDGGGFVMPSDGVDILATTRPLTYRVVFRSDDILLKECTVAYGELPPAPPAPTRAPDASYSYVFVGWSEEITPAYADATYEAVYERIPVPAQAENAFGGTLFRWFSKIFRTIFDFFLRLFSGQSE